MGLKGQLEDLPLLDMLQIIAFSKKSGYLRVSGSKGRGAVLLKEGRVLFSYSWSTASKLRELVADPSRITPEVIKECIESALKELGGLREGSFQFELTDALGEEIGGVGIKPFLLEHGLDPQELLLDLAVDMDNERREATSLLELAFKGSAIPEEDEDLGEGDDFEAPTGYAAAVALAAEEPEPEPEPEVEALVSAPLPESEFEPEPEPTPAPAPPIAQSPRPRPTPSSPSSIPDRPRGERGITVVLVDDEKPVLDVVGRELVRIGYRVHTASTPSRGAELVRARREAGERVLVAVDLKMPTTSGRSFYGGFELVRKTQRLEGVVPVLLMVESLSEKAKIRAKELGVRRVVHKPTLTKIDPELYQQDLREFAAVIDGQLGKLAEDVGARADGAVASPPPPPKPAITPTPTPAPVAVASSAPEPGPGTDRVNGATSKLDFLATMTRKLVDPRGSEDVSRLVMDVAQTFLERGVLFVVKADVAKGLAAFGVAPGTQASNALAKRVVIDIGSCQPLQEVVRTGAAYPLTDLRTLEGPLYSVVGRGQAAEGILIPLLYNRATLLVLYGDNGKSGSAIGELSSLELFMAQAGMALENKLLQQKLGAGMRSS